MFHDKITDYFAGVAAKYLSAVDADPGRSNGHEIGGLPAAGAKSWLGSPSKNQRILYEAKHVYIADTDEDLLICDSNASWYDARQNQPARSPEYRLYYHDSDVIRRIRPGDFFLVARHHDGRLLMVFTPPHSSVESQLRAIFGIPLVEEKFTAGDLKGAGLLLPLRLMLESLGFELSKPEPVDGEWLDLLICQFGEDAFPRTQQFSTYARASVSSVVDPIGDPDRTLLTWMEHEEKLFRIYERHFVTKRIKQGFGTDDKGVEDFIAYSLSVQNRRKSRVGHAFEGHLRELFAANSLRFQQGAKSLVTENNARPDFLFPSFDAYHDVGFPIESLTMLGAKTTCKDRWRQVLSEADRIPAKYLVTLEPAISKAQTDEMADHQLQLVIPRAIHPTFAITQQQCLMDLSEFIAVVKDRQRSAEADPSFSAITRPALHV